MQDIESIHRAEYETATEPLDSFVVAQSPGRMHLLGEHGEAGGGLLLSMAINRWVRISLSLRRDTSLRFYAVDLGERKRTTLINLKYKREDRWANYLKLAVHAFLERGYPVRGLNFSITGNIPQQVGLASSSAIEIASAVALRSIYAPDMTDGELVAILAQAGNSFLGRSDIAVDHCLLLGAASGQFSIVDARLMQTRLLKPPLEGYRILITDSRVPRVGVESELKQRRGDVKKGVELLSHKKDGASLRDYATEDLVESMGALPEQIRRRSMHVVQETRRVLDSEEAFRKGDLAAFSKIILHSHESLRDLYEVSCPEIDWLVKRAQELSGVLCSRMTGQGFGGCTYTIIAEAKVQEYRTRLEDYERIFGFKPLVYEVSASGPARILSHEETHADSSDQ